MRSKQAQLKILVIVSFVLILAGWLWYVSQIGLVRKSDEADSNWWQDLVGGYEFISSDLDRIKYNIGFYKRAATKKTDNLQIEAVKILKEKIEKQASSTSTTSTTSTIDKVNNAEEEKTGE